MILGDSKKLKDLLNKKFQVFEKEIEEDVRRWKDLPCSWVSKIVKNIVKKNGHPTINNLDIQHNIHQKSYNSLQTLKRQFLT